VVSQVEFSILTDVRFGSFFRLQGLLSGEVLWALPVDAGLPTLTYGDDRPATYTAGRGAAN
jgi:hypothetical protein